MSKAKVKPLHDRVLIERMENEEKTASGLYIPETAKEKPQRGKVVAVGTGRITEDGKVRPLAVKVGDSVIYGKYSGTEIKVDGSEYLMMKEEDILGIVEGA